MREPTSYEKLLLEYVVSHVEPEAYDDAILEYRSLYLLQELHHTQANLLRVIPQDYTGEVIICGADCQAVRQAGGARFSSMRFVSEEAFSACACSDALALVVIRDAAMLHLVEERSAREELTLLLYRMIPRKQMTMIDRAEAETLVSGEQLLGLLCGKALSETKLAVICSNERARERSIYTEIVQLSSGKRVVRKCPDGAAAQGHIAHLKRMEEKLRELYRGRVGVNTCELRGENAEFSYVASTNVMEELRAEAIKGTVETLLARLEAYLELVLPKELQEPFHCTDAFLEIFGRCSDTDAARLEQMTALPVSDIDMIPENMMTEGPTLIDYEWTFDFPIPSAYLCYRILFYVGKQLQETGLVTTETLYTHFGISEADAALFDKMEHQLQCWIEGGRLLYRNLETELSEHPYVTVYYGASASFSEEKSFRVPIEGPNVFIRNVLPTEARYLRVDPGEAACTVRVCTMKINGQTQSLAAANGVPMEGQTFVFAQRDPILLSEQFPEAEQYLLDAALEIVPLGNAMAQHLAHCAEKKTEQEQQLAALTAELSVYEHSRMFALGRLLRKLRGR